MHARTYFGPDPLSLLPDSLNFVSAYGYPSPVLSITITCSGLPASWLPGESSQGDGGRRGVSEPPTSQPVAFWLTGASFFSLLFGVDVK